MVNEKIRFRETSWPTTCPCGKKDLVYEKVYLGASILKGDIYLHQQYCQSARASLSESRLGAKP